MNEKEILEIISTLKWTFAKTMAYWPHWYTVRQRDDEILNGMYDTLFRFIYDNTIFMFSTAKNTGIVTSVSIHTGS